MDRRARNYLDTSLSAQERADDLLQRMSIEEKMGQIVGYMPDKGSIEKLEKDYPQGAGEVVMLFAGELDSKESVVEKVTRIQDKIMELSDHRIPAIFHLETLAGALLPEATSFLRESGKPPPGIPRFRRNWPRLFAIKLGLSAFRMRSPRCWIFPAILASDVKAKRMGKTLRWRPRWEQLMYRVCKTMGTSKKGYWHAPNILSATI